MKLGHRSDDELVEELTTLCGSQRRITASVIAYLAEVDARKVHVDLGYHTLFAFCIKRLGMSHGEAAVRTKVTKLYRAHPLIMDPLEAGTVHLTSLYLVREHMNDKNCSKLLASITGKTTREVESIIARLFPRQGVRASIRKLPTRRSDGDPNLEVACGESLGANMGEEPTVPRGVDGTLAKVVSSPSAVASERTIDLFCPSLGLATEQSPATAIASQPASRALAPQEPSSNNTTESSRIATIEGDVASGAEPRMARKPLREFEQYSADSHKVQFMATTKFRKKIERAARLSSHRNRGELALLMEHAIDVLLSKLESNQLAKLKRLGRSAAVTVEKAGAAVVLSGSKGATEVNPMVSRNATQAQEVDSGGTEANAATLSPKRVETVVSAPHPTTVDDASISRSVEHRVKLPSDRRGSGDRERAGRAFGRSARRAAFDRDGEQCSFVGRDGVRCEAKSFLQVDHIRPRARGGGGETENARVLCAAHNRHEARRAFGHAFMDEKLAKAQQRSGPPREEAG